MKQRLKAGELLAIATMLFGMFFGAGNLIFPAYMGWQAGSNIRSAIIGFLITGVGIPMLGVVAIGISRSNGLLELSNKVGKKYSMFFTIALYLTIGPFFAIPRCATVPFSVSVKPLISGDTEWWVLPIFTFFFFTLVFFFSYRKGKLLLWIGKVLTPVFLIFLLVLIAASIINPLTSPDSVSPSGDYATNAFSKGFLEGYNTMDALASLAFGVVVVDAVRNNYKIKNDAAVAGNTALAGIFSCIIMAVIYIFVTIMGAVCYNRGTVCENGGDVLAQIASYHFGNVGLWILAVTVTLACLKTAVGLVSSCARTFETIFKDSLSYKKWVIIFSVFSFGVANIGLSAIIEYALPVLMFIYPLAITLIILSLAGKLFGNDKTVYRFVTVFTIIPAFFDFMKALPDSVKSILHLNGIVKFADDFFPLFEIGFGWLIPALAGFATGFAVHMLNKTKAKTKESKKEL